MTVELRPGPSRLVRSRELESSHWACPAARPLRLAPGYVCATTAGTIVAERTRMPASFDRRTLLAGGLPASAPPPPPLRHASPPTRLPPPPNHPAPPHPTHRPGPA